ncbi:protein of unknown function DUF583 [Gemmatirosa kalamazoonensis]|uniref:Polymer-forming cytoskeletal protein n=1 Tax=Gemmatirosa kalamazoonensis TaxID=861299 RepID=W0RK02_9BACT|nr:polymer-forming cytoskeletal protein [Gemmatirosa kalamazoonensis]AHG89723.1 protein of unknown function DUF583 [Gemmatirosa kalamazoonensis]
MFRRRKPQVAGDGLVVGSEDAVRGTLAARTVTVAGHVDGTLDVAGALFVLESGRVSGMVRATRFVAEAGAVVRATCRIGVPAASEGDALTADAPARKAVLKLTPRAMQRVAPQGPGGA